jgi:hypothetical protein
VRAASNGHGAPIASLTQREFEDERMVLAEYELTLFAARDAEIADALHEWDAFMIGDLARAFASWQQKRSTSSASAASVICGSTRRVDFTIVDPTHLLVLHQGQFPREMTSGFDELDYEPSDSIIYGTSSKRLNNRAIMKFSAELVVFPNIRAIPDPSFTWCEPHSM